MGQGQLRCAAQRQLHPRRRAEDGRGDAAAEAAGQCRRMFRGGQRRTRLRGAHAHQRRHQRNRVHGRVRHLPEGRSQRELLGEAQEDHVPARRGHHPRLAPLAHRRRREVELEW